jgi:hypothetical protein
MTPVSHVKPDVSEARYPASNMLTLRPDLPAGRCGQDRHLAVWSAGMDNSAAGRSTVHRGCRVWGYGKRRCAVNIGSSVDHRCWRHVSQVNTTHIDSADHCSRSHVHLLATNAEADEAEEKVRRQGVDGYESDQSEVEGMSPAVAKLDIEAPVKLDSKPSEEVDGYVTDDEKERPSKRQR